MRFSILSNGTLIDDEMAAFLASTKRCNYVQVSIDGSMPGSHDAMRGKGSFAKALQGLMTLRRHGVHAAVRVTIHRKNVHDLEGVAKLLLEDLGFPPSGPIPRAHMGLCRKNAEMVQLTTEDRIYRHGDPASADEEIQRTDPGHGGAAGRGEGLARHGGGPARRKRESMPNRGFLTGCGCYRSASRRAGRRGHHALHDALPHRVGPDQPRRPRGDLEKPRRI